MPNKSDTQNLRAENEEPHSSKPAAFQTTHWSLILEARNAEDPERASQALETLCNRYWAPLYHYLRRTGASPHDAQDTTQGFFAALLEKDKLKHVCKERGRFRSFLLTALKNFHLNERDKLKTEKRGVRYQIASLDQLKAEKQFEAESALKLSAEEAFDRKWAQSVIDHTTLQLKPEFERAGSSHRYELLKNFLISDPEPGQTYQHLAEQINISQRGLRSAIHRMRQRFIKLFQDEIASTVENPTEVAEEVTYLWKILSR